MNDAEKTRRLIRKWIKRVNSTEDRDNVVWVSDEEIDILAESLVAMFRPVRNTTGHAMPMNWRNLLSVDDEEEEWQM